MKNYTEQADDMSIDILLTLICHSDDSRKLTS